MLRHCARALVTMFVGLVVFSASPAQGVGVLVADHVSGGGVTVLDASLALIGTVTLPSSPTANPIGIAVNPAGTLAAVSNFLANRIDFLDVTASPPAVTGASVSFTSPALFPEDLVFSSDGACLLVSDGRPGFVASVDVTNRTVVTSLSDVQSQAVEVIPNNPDNLVLTADQLGNVIHALTLGAGCALTDTGTAVPTTGTGPTNITALPNGQRALVSNLDGTIDVLGISGSTVSVIASLGLPGATPGITPSSGRAQSIAILPSGSRAYVYQAVAGNVEVLTIDSSNTIADSGVGIPVPPNGNILGVELIATDGDSVFVSTTAGVSAIDVLTNQVTGSATAGSQPAGIAVQGTPSPTDQTQNLIGLLQSFDLPAGDSNMLLAKLRQALKDLSNGKTAHACKALRLFIQEVNRQTQHANRQLSQNPLEADELIATANYIQTVLGCQ